MNKYKINVPMRIATVIFSFVLVSTYLLCNQMYARFITNSDASDEARVAKFVLSVSEIESATITVTDLVPGTTKKVYFSVTSGSETDVNLKAKVENTGRLPLTYKITECVTDGITDDIADIDLSGTDMVWFDSMQSGDTTRSYGLEITWPRTEKDSEYSNLIVAYKLIVLAEQIG